MNDDLKMALSGIGALIALAWVATKAGPLGTLTGSLATGGAKIIGALGPGQSSGS